MSRMTRRLLVWLPPLLLFTVEIACNRSGTNSLGGLSATSAAQTFSAQLAEGRVGSPTLELPASTPSIPPAATDTSEPTLPSDAPPDSDCADRASFVSDVTIPDDTSLPPGEGFTKTWRVKNTGSCTWTTAYSLVFVDGNDLSGPSSQPLLGNVAPNESTDISLELRAPVTNGVHRGNWKLRNSNGDVFGVGAGGPIYVQIVVGPTLTPATKGQTVYNLAESYCDAEWRSTAGVLPCPGTEGDSNGFVVRLEQPKFENEAVEDELTLLTRPQMVTDGVISGRFPALQVKSGYHFRTYIGCRYDSAECSVIYQLNYRVDGGSLQNLNQWNQSYDGEWQKVDIDLSSLAGRSVEFILAVTTNGASTDDDAYWLNPKIIN